VFCFFPLSSFYEGKWSFVMFTTTTSTLSFLCLLLIPLSLSSWYIGEEAESKHYCSDYLDGYNLHFFGLTLIVVVVLQR